MAKAAKPALPEPSRTSAGLKGRLVPILVVGGLMLAEGIGVFILAKSLSPAPASAIAAGLGAGKSGSSGGSVPLSSDSLAEVELADCRPINKMSGRFLTFQVRVAALVDASDAELLTALARQKRARIEDAINTVVRSAEPSQLNEPTLDTLERRIKMEMDKIFGDDKLIKAILIPQFLQSGPGV